MKTADTKKTEKLINYTIDGSLRALTTGRNSFFPLLDKTGAEILINKKHML